MASSDSIGFSAEFAVEGGDLILRYEVVNRDRRDLYLLNRLYRTTPEWDLSPDVIYVHLDLERRTVWLNKRIPDIPEGVLVNAPVAPFVTPVRAGESFREEVRIPLPIREYRQYGFHGGGPSPRALKGEPREETFGQVYFSLGYYWRMEGTEEEIRNIRGAEVVHPVAPAGSGFPEFGELESEVHRIELPVLIHSEP